MRCTVYRRCKNVQIRIKNVNKRKNVTKIKDTFVNVIKTVPFLSLVQLTSEAQDMAFKSTQNMPFSLVLQKLSSFLASSEI